MKKILYTAVTIATLLGCTKKEAEGGSTQQPPGVAVEFRGSATRVANGAWQANDKIGIYMVWGGATHLDDVIDGVANTPYKVDGTGVSTSFTPLDKIIYYPATNQAVDFYAYTPHSTDITAGEYPVSVAQQEPHSAIDVMAASAHGKNLDDKSVVFDFRHCLSMLTLNVKCGDGVASLEGLTTTLKGHPTEATISIHSKKISGHDALGNIVALTSVETAGSKATSRLLVIPSSPRNGAQVLFALGESHYVWDISTVEFEQGQHLVYDVILENLRVTVNPATIAPWDTSEEITGTAK